MTGNICLVVIYNHNYEKNIPLINKIYEGRFSNVFHVVPFYQGAEKNVIGVYENSYQFNGYVTQAAHRYISEKYSHYVFVADDLVINPKINESNICDWLHIDKKSGFIRDLHLFDDDVLFKWRYGLPSAKHFNTEGNDVEWRRFAPTIEEARLCFERHGLDWRKGLSRKLYWFVACFLKVKRQTPYMYEAIPPMGLLRTFRRWFGSKEKLYPMVKSFSDFFVVPGCKIRQFCHLSGVFAAKRMFVESAIPTAMVLTLDKIITLDKLGLQAENGNLTKEQRDNIANKYQFDFQKLMREFPSDYLYIHPVKLSKWKF